MIRVGAGVAAISSSPGSGVAAATSSSPVEGASATSRVMQGSPEECVQHAAQLGVPPSPSGDASARRPPLLSKPPAAMDGDGGGAVACGRGGRRWRESRGGAAACTRGGGAKM